jgi:ComF family protein
MAFQPNKGRIFAKAFRCSIAFFHDVMEWTFPRTCLRCGSFLGDECPGYVCGRCRADYALITGSVCAICGSPHLTELLPGRLCPNCVAASPAFFRARSLFLYRGTGAHLIHALKYEGGRWAEAEIQHLLQNAEEIQTYLQAATVIPVPLHRRKLRHRGYNQAMVVARAIAGVVPEVSIWDGMVRARDTPSQTDLSRKQRQRNVRGAFALGRKSPPSGRLVLVDDVLTTGATLGEAAKALHRVGRKEISAFTLAHG